MAEAIRAQAAAAGDEECCGLLLGDRESGVVSALLAARNVAADPRRCFEVDPAVLLAAYRNARGGGPDVIGHYHSHPFGIAMPSTTDAAMAAGAGEIWLIVGHGGTLGAWRALPGGEVHGRFKPVSMTIDRS